MQSSLAQIEDWFARHDDGEFTRLPPDAPYSWVAPLSPVERLIYTTKPRVLAAAVARVPGTHVGFLGRYGLPGAHDADWIARLAAAQSLEFLGDLDPPDLLVFIWLCERIGQNRVAFQGISDALLASAGVSVDDLPWIALSPAEQVALPLVDRLAGGLASLVGPSCAALLERGRKVELEAIAFQAGSPLTRWLQAGN
ncbi:MAG: hypothetical protein U0836_26910 [Pirellulales bacterium]